MKRLRRTYFGNPLLREKAKRVGLRSIKTPAFQKLIEEMFFTMRRVGGVGLAAPQIGKSLQLAVIEIRKSAVRPDIVPLPPTVIINPKIETVSKTKQSDWEGCLSLPSVRGLVPRHKRITVSYFDEAGKKQVMTFSGFRARVFQHEIDHLNGLLYVDRMPDMRTLMTANEFKGRILKRGLKSR